MKYIVPAVSGLILSGCVNGLSVGPSVNETAGVSADPNLVRPLARPATLDTTPAPPPPPTARTVEQFDTTTAEDRAEAVAEAEPRRGNKIRKHNCVPLDHPQIRGSG